MNNKQQVTLQPSSHTNYSSLQIDIQQPINKNKVAQTILPHKLLNSTDAASQQTRLTELRPEVYNIAELTMCW